jgi:hypothetical protein
VLPILWFGTGQHFFKKRPRPRVAASRRTHITIGAAQ